MSNNRKVRVAITHGDTNGIGYELIFKAFEEPTMLELCTPIIYGSPKVATYHRNALEMEVTFTIINDISEVQDNRINFIPVFDEEIKVELGIPTEESGNAGLLAIDRALEDYNAGGFDVLVTAPLENNECFHFSGQSRYIEDHLPAEEPSLSMLISENMRIALATRNLPLKQVAESLSIEKITESGCLLFQSIRRDFRISNPRIAILALNPKAGDNGLLGSEEQELIEPAIDILEKENILTFGPYAADKFFAGNDWDKFDGILAMYYEQGLTPFRSLTVEGGVSYLAGLRLIRTTPEVIDNFSIAGKGNADAMPMRHAIFLAIDIFRHRKEYDAPMGNPLPKLYKERRDDSEKVRFTIPKRKEE